MMRGDGKAAGHFELARFRATERRYLWKWGLDDDCKRGPRGYLRTLASPL